MIRHLVAGPNDQETRRRRREALGEFARRDYARPHLRRFVEDLSAWAARVEGQGGVPSRLPPALASRGHLVTRPSVGTRRQLERLVMDDVTMGEALDFVLARLGVATNAVPPSRRLELAGRVLDHDRLRTAVEEALADPA